MGYDTCLVMKIFTIGLPAECDTPLRMSLGINTQDLAWYEVSEVVTAWCLFVAAASHLGHSPTFLYDLVDLTRQALANIAPIFYLKVKEAYR